MPRPTPGPGELFGYALRWRAGLPLRALRGLREFRRETEDAWGELRLRARVLARMFLEQYGRASQSPINGPIGPHRTFGWVDMDLAELRAARRAFGCTLNDLVLCIVTGAFRDYLRLRGVRPEFRIQAPVSVRSEDEKGRLGNRVSGWVVTLPLGEEDPRLQLAAIQETTRDLKESKQALGVEMMMAAMGEMPTALLSLGMQAASGTINSIVTNVPGPQFPLYLQGARMQALYPQVPLLQGLGLGIAGKVCWGFNADPKLVPDLEVFVAAIRSSQARVLALARPEPAGEPLAPHEAARSRSGGSAPPARSG